ncbi:CAP domain-containing protein [Paractinoplanes hotanensis]|uniref:CAP domain-containing protein n=1 Tax=Paractinoplanes hotanensis TaxID=2906497 RepID=A0ABT0XVH9_9ACTN|nr:CAP domain-containing protein [Actinoplanes hotanensis]MCM4077801.1 CAP domain-containing protein [Actinoplanes hotanensis]
MRKPVVVVSAAAALLLGGGFVATSAAADERPETPGWSSFWWPSLFGGGDDGSSFSGGDNFAGDGSGDSGDGEPSAGRGPALDDSRSRPGSSAQGDDHVRRQQDRVALPPAQPQNSVRNNAQAPTQPKHQTLAAQPKQQHREQPRVVREQPRQVQRPAADVMAGARQAVTASDVSASPSAPVQQRVLRLINQNRRHGGCDPFTLDRRLIEAANDHAADMARRDYFAHESPSGDSAGDRVSERGYRWKRYGENIARGADSAYEVVNGWMNSPTHRENILDCRLREMGVGLAIARDRTPYWVQDFATPES